MTQPMRTPLPLYNRLTVAIRAVIYGEQHPMVQHMRLRNASMQLARAAELIR